MTTATTFRCFTFSPFLHHRHTPLRRLLHRIATVNHHHTLFSPSYYLSPPQCTHQHHFQTKALKFDQTHLQPLESTDKSINLWPEWLEFSNWISRSVYSNGSLDFDDFIEEDLPVDFFGIANGCLRFAWNFPDLLWSLPREDIEVVVDSGSPFLFKDACGTTKRMKAFLGSGTNDVLGSDKPSTVDLMRFLLSYVGMKIVSSQNRPLDNRVELSVRKLFNELAKSKGLSVESSVQGKKNFHGEHGKPPRSFGENIGTKRGKWLCPRCNYMNIAKNSKCHECDETRPTRYLTGREWECPRCNFHNFGRNVTCLRCDCKKDSVNSSTSLKISSGLAANSSSSQDGMQETLTGTEQEMMLSWFAKINQSEEFSDKSNSLTVDPPKTEVMRDLGNHANSDGYYLQKHGVNSNVNVEINSYSDKVSSEKTSTSISNEGADFSAIRRDANLSGMSISPSTKYGHVDGNQTEKTERWFKKGGEVHDVTDLPTVTSDEDFPENMPMRKGENRFVVSKKKDRSLTSPMYKRRMATEQASNNTYVPFVPFPPGYFTKEKLNEGSDSLHVTSNNSDSVSVANQQPAVGMSSNSGRTEENETIPNKQANNAYINNNQTSDSQFRSKSRDGYSSETNLNNGSSQSSDHSNQSIREDWRGRSLEGSAVKEPDPLDVSEEAKAERWFRRVSQIKDISELSQIPDEDFPSIMPLRKGVNRFVVSKRKTPLERRLTSSKYRRNLPTVSPDPVKKEDD